jgi:hypothetical protein
MHVISALSAISDHIAAYLVSLFLAGLIGIGLNYIFLRKYTSGLIYVQISFAFNTAIILFGWWNGNVTLFHVAHYFIYEMTVVVGVYWVYRQILKGNARLFESLQKMNVGTVSALLVMYNVAISLMVIKYVVGIGGASRIGYMTAPWFSFVRPIMFILDPLSCLFSIYLFDRGKRILPALILASTVIASILGGSKASYLYGVLIMLLFYEDLKGGPLVIPKALKSALVIGLCVSAVVTLARLNENATSMETRLVLTGESTIEVYYSDDPTAAASGVSTLAKIHRGVAKVLGDSSANDPDTLFGYALNRVEYGANTFTGPNAAIASYMLCNYSGWENLIGFASIFGYLAIVSWFYDIFIYRHGQATPRLIYLPFLVTSLYNFPQEYNHGMSDLTLICILALSFAWISLAVVASQGVRSILDTA